jgi:hypothetical protein
MMASILNSSAGWCRPQHKQQQWTAAAALRRRRWSFRLRSTPRAGAPRPRKFQAFPSGCVLAKQIESFVFVQAGASTCGCKRSMWQPLHCAAQQGHAPIVELLLSSGASAPAANKVTPLLDVCGTWYIVYNPAQDGWTALHLACR